MISSRTTAGKVRIDALNFSTCYFLFPIPFSITPSDTDEASECDIETTNINNYDETVEMKEQ